MWRGAPAARPHRPRGCLRALLLVAALARAAGDGDGLFACCTAAPAAAGDCTPSRGTPNDPVQCAALGELFNNDWAAVQGWVDPTAALGWASAALGYATDFCSFPGVVCDDGGNVTHLLMVDEDGSGRNAGAGQRGIPASLGALTALQHLELGSGYQGEGTTPNVYRGTLPASLASLTALTYLCVSGLNLTGTVPAALLALESLGFFDATFTGMTGTVIKLSVSALDYLLYKPLIAVPVLGEPPATTLQEYLSEHRDQSATVVLTQDASLLDTIIVDNINVTFVGAASCVANRGELAGAPLPCTVTAAPGARHFYLSGGASLQLMALALVGGTTDKNALGGAFGGAVHVRDSSTLHAAQCAFLDNQADFGGAIYTESSASAMDNVGLRMDNCTLLRNSATSTGGAILATGAAVALSGLQCSGNAAAFGGCIYAEDVKTFSLSGGSTLAGNTATYGGAIYATGAAVALSGLQCSGNAAAAFGGCIYAEDVKTFSLSGGSTLAGNTAACGGALVFDCTAPPCNATRVLEGATLADNIASLQGGALYMLGGGLRMDNCTLLRNGAMGASAQAGAVFVAEYAQLPLNAPAITLTDVMFDGNAVALRMNATSPPGSTKVVGAGYGGAVLLVAEHAQGATVVLTRGALRGNAAVDGGGLLLFGNVVLSVTNTTFDANTASGVGGALNMQPSGAINATLSGVAFTGNAAAAGGAVAMAAGSTLSASGCAFTGNLATNGAAFWLTVAGSALPPPTLALAESIARGNTASFAGGFAFTDATSADAVALPTCTPAAGCVGNAALNGADALAAPPVRAACTATLLVAASGALVPEFNVSLLNALATRVMVVPGVSVTVSANVSADGARGLRGATTVAYADGVARFSLLRVTDAPGTVYGLIYVISAPSMPALDGQRGEVAVTVAACDAATQVLDAVSVTCACRPGFFLDAGTQACARCADGTHASAAGALACTPNMPGYHSTADRTAQLPCAAGTFLNGSSLACEPCELGTYTAVTAQVACRVNPAGSVSVPQTTFAAALTLAGLNASAFGAAQNRTLSASVAAVLNVSASAVLIGAVQDALSRRRLLLASSLSVDFSVATQGTDAATASGVRASLASGGAFAPRLASALAASGDAVLGAVTPASLAVSEVAETTVFLDSEFCPDGTFLNGLTKLCESCPHGLISKADRTGCLACQPRMAWRSSALCVPCPVNSITSPANPAQCACEPGHYDTRFGASLAEPACALCPRGGVCTTGLVAAAAGFWRNSTRSDTFFRCREGNCLEELVDGPLGSSSTPTAQRRRLLANASDAPTNCVEGNTGPLCGICLPGFALQSGQCLPCNPDDAWDVWSESSKAGLIVGCAVAALIFLAFAIFQPLVPALERTADAILAACSAALARCVGCFKACFCCCWRRRNKAGADADEDDDARGAKHAGASVDALAALGAAPAAAAPAEGVPAGDAPLASSGTKSEHHHKHRFNAAAVDHSLAANATFAVGNAFALAAEVDGIVDEDDNEEAEVGGVERHLDFMDKLEELYLQVQKTGKIFVNFFQIVSTFLKSLDVPWPHIFGVIMARVNVLNLNLVQLPSTACLNPSPSYYKQFNGYTLGLLFALLLMAAMWQLGTRVVLPLSMRGATEADRAARLIRFKSTVMSRALLLLYLVYPGVSVAIFAIFSCTTLDGGKSYLDADLNIVCYDRTHWRYMGGAIVWLVLVPLGIPCFFLWLLHTFQVPQMARLLADNAWLRELIRLAWAEKVPQPNGASDLTVDSITDAHLEALYAFFLHDVSAEEAGNILSGAAPPFRVKEEDAQDETPQPSRAAVAAAALQRQLGIAAGIQKSESRRLSMMQTASEACSLVDAAAASARRAFLLDVLMSWCRSSGDVSIPLVYWERPDADETERLAALPANVLAVDKLPSSAPPARGLRCAELAPLMDRALIEVGFLFGAYRAECWYWETVELLRKLALTSILALIAPGSAGQVVVGLLLAFFMLLLNLQIKPYAQPTLNFVSAVTQTNLFFFLLVALLLKVDMDGESGSGFYGGLVAVMFLVPFALPVIIRIIMRFHGGGLEARALVRDNAWE